MTSYEFPKWKVGASFKCDFGPKLGRDNDNQGRRFHNRAFVDGCAVIRKWCENKECWVYSVKGPQMFVVDGNVLVPVKAPCKKGADQ
ncbi:hypothetical protein HFO61_30335 [Rhizobium leguminosarum]|uniref:hypothetical protein n=1 Tax=Rhizobium leguminosarum TaxID=384 RepID=UPI001C93872C|nr:hypothetical protein [Rhizobium leguminosarum]MBY5551046.1 hypothetical protein [Rhizobium leguminosarum]